jgi:hypothetical protein
MRVSTTTYTNAHRTTIAAVPAVDIVLGTAGMLTDPLCRQALALVAGYPDTVLRRARERMRQERALAEHAGRLVLDRRPHRWGQMVDALAEAGGDRAAISAALGEWGDWARTETIGLVEGTPLRPERRMRLVAEVAQALPDLVLA